MIEAFIDHHQEALFLDTHLPYVTLSGALGHPTTTLVRGQQAPLV